MPQKIHGTTVYPDLLGKAGSAVQKIQHYSYNKLSDEFTTIQCYLKRCH